MKTENKLTPVHLSVMPFDYSFPVTSESLQASTRFLPHHSSTQQFLTNPQVNINLHHLTMNPVLQKNFCYQTKPKKDVFTIDPKEHDWLSELLLKELHPFKPSLVEAVCDPDACDAAFKAIFVQMAMNDFMCVETYIRLKMLQLHWQTGMTFPFHPLETSFLSICGYIYLRQSIPIMHRFRF